MVNSSAPELKNINTLGPDSLLPQVSMRPSGFTGVCLQEDTRDEYSKVRFSQRLEGGEELLRTVCGEEKQGHLSSLFPPVDVSPSHISGFQLTRGISTQFPG